MRKPVHIEHRRTSFGVLHYVDIPAKFVVAWNPAIFHDDAIDDDDRGCRDNGYVFPDIRAGEDGSWAIDLGGPAEHRTLVLAHLDA